MTPSGFEMLFLVLSDTVPVLPHARSWVMIEQVAGLPYVAFLISRIVGLTTARQRPRPIGPVTERFG